MSGDTRRGRLGRHAITRSGLVLVQTASVFLVYGYLLRAFGERLFGVWVVIASFGVATQLSAGGAEQAAVHYIAATAEKDDGKALRRYYDAARVIALTVGAGLTVVLATVGVWILKYAVPQEFLSRAREAFYYALLSFFIGGLAAVSSGTLDGAHRIDLRAGLASACVVLYSAVCVYLAHKYGLVGAALALLFHSSLRLVVFTVAVRCVLTQIRIMPNILACLDEVRSMIRYALGAQVSSVFVLLFDPLAKLLLSASAGPEAATVLEIPNKLVSKVRELLVAGYSVIVPRIAAMQGAGNSGQHHLRRSSVIFLAVIIASFGALPAVGQAIIRYWTGQSGTSYYVVMMTLLPGAFVNTVTSPLYFENLAKGRLRPNILAHAAHTVVLVLLWAIGMTGDAQGMALAVTLSLSVGAIVLASAAWMSGSGGYLAASARDLVPFTVLVLLGGAASFASPQLMELRSGAARTVLTQLIIFVIVLAGAVACSSPLRRLLKGYFAEKRRDAV